MNIFSTYPIVIIGFSLQAVNITGFPHNIHNLSLWGIKGFSVILTALFHRYCRENLWTVKPCKHLQCGFPKYECTGHPNYDRKQGFLPFTLVLGTLIDKSWLIYLALYIGEERNRKEKKEKKQKMGCFLYLINWLTQTEKRYISHLEEIFHSVQWYICH